MAKKTELELNEMILKITNKIRANNPELLVYLDEMPITVPYAENPELVITTLTSYHESLVVLLDKNNTKTVVEVVEIAQSLPIQDIKVMELDTSYQDLILEANNFTISYNDIGEGKIPVILLHGFPFDKSMWKGQLDHLKSSNRVIAIDIRGFGLSKDETTALSIDLFTDDLLAFMNKLKIEKATLCGLSMGGYIALNAMKRFPERFEALILCDTQCISDTPSVKESRYQTIDNINLEGAAAFNEKFIKSVFHPESLTTATEIVEHLRSIVFANTTAIITAGLTALAERAETCSVLSTINIPTLIICGREDQVTPLEQSRFMHKRIEGSALKVIENAGHVSNLEQADAFNQCLVEFLTSNNK